MSPVTSNASAGEDEPAGEHRETLVAELERRIHELDGHADHEFGGFDRIDWIILLLCALLLPILLVIRFAP